MMKAIVYDRYGPAEVLHVAELPEPSPAPNEVLIEVHAVEATKADVEMRSFRFAVKWFWLPLRLALGLRQPKRRVLGSYFAGEVVATGSDVRRLRVGDAVFGCAQLRLGGYGERVALPEEFTIAAKPKILSYAQAASVPLGGLNALHFMTRAEIKPGERVLVNGAGGSIGIYAVQIAKHLGAEVTAVDKDAKLDLLRSIGADRVMDYAREDFTRDEKKYDVIFNMVAGSSYSKNLRALARGGRLLLGNPRFSDMLRSPFARLRGKRTIFAFAREKQAELEHLRELLESGRIRAVVDRILPMEQAAQAHRLVEDEQRRGAVILTWKSPGP